MGLPTSSDHKPVRFLIGGTAFMFSPTTLQDPFAAERLGGTHLLAACARRKEDMLVVADDAGNVIIDRDTTIFSEFFYPLILSAGSPSAYAVLNDKLSRTGVCDLAAAFHEAEYFCLPHAVDAIRYQYQRMYFSSRFVGIFILHQLMDIAA